MRQAMVGIGPCVIERVPVSHFRKLPGSAIESAWHLVGPSVQMNLGRAPLWAVIAAAYLEGMEHGANAAIAASREVG